MGVSFHTQVKGKTKKPEPFLQRRHDPLPGGRAVGALEGAESPVPGAGGVRLGGSCVGHGGEDGECPPLPREPKAPVLHPRDPGPSGTQRAQEGIFTDAVSAHGGTWKPGLPNTSVARCPPRAWRAHGWGFGKGSHLAHLLLGGEEAGPGALARRASLPLAPAFTLCFLPAVSSFSAALPFCHANLQTAD